MVSFDEAVKIVRAKTFVGVSHYSELEDVFVFIVADSARHPIIVFDKNTNKILYVRKHDEDWNKYEHLTYKRIGKTKLTSEEQERLQILEASGIYSDSELERMRSGLIKYIKIEDGYKDGYTDFCYCFDDGGVYRIITLGPTPSGGDYVDVYFFDKKYKSTRKENAVSIDIHEMKLNGELIYSTWLKR